MIDRIREMQEGLAPQAEELQETALHYLATAREGLAEGGKWIRDFVNNEPVKAAGVALGLGVVLGWLVKRR